VSHKKKDSEHNSDNCNENKEKGYLTSKEVKELKKTTGDLEKFLNLLEKLKTDLQRSTKFDESYELIVKFVRENRQEFRASDERIWNMVKQLDAVAYDMQKEMSKVKHDAKQLIEKTVKLYNNEFHSDIVFDGDVMKWLSRTFPLVKLYVNKKLKEDDSNE